MTSSADHSPAGSQLVEAVCPIATLLTPSGRGAISTIQIVSDAGDADVISRLPFRRISGTPLSQLPIGRIAFGSWENDPPEHLTVCRINDRTIEIHCHGGTSATSRILHDLQELGIGVVSPFEWKVRTQGVFAAELAEALSLAVTARTAGYLLAQMSGGLRSQLESLRSQAWNAEHFHHCIEESLRWAEFGLHLARPWNVLIVGRPNVGKSSLLNALLGYRRSIVFDQPGTTRDTVTATTSIDGWAFEISDTAGIRDTLDELEAAGVHRAYERLAAADLALVMIDVSEPLNDDDRRLLSAVNPTLVVANKCDLPNHAALFDGREFERSVCHLVSAKTGEGIDRLLQAISQRLVPCIPDPHAPIPVTERQVAVLQRAHAACREGNETACYKFIDELLSRPRIGPREARPNGSEVIS